ncbi:MAG: hypothetical protein ACYCSG_02830 [Thermoplasmataceae archaeon]
MFVSIAVAVLFLMPNSVAFAQNANGHQTFRVGNEIISIQGNTVKIGFGSNLTTVSWDIYMIQGEKAVKLHLHWEGVHRIISAYQDSVVLRQGNSLLKVGEMFSFYKNQINSNLILTNLADKNETFIALFSLTSPDHSREFLGQGLHQGFNLTANQTNPSVSSLIPKNYYVMEENGLSVSWRQELGIFHAGITQQTQRGSSLGLPFGPITLQSNETYAIDPVISPMMFTGPPGGGGGGGGTCPGGYVPPMSSFPVNASNWVYNSNGQVIGLITQSVCGQSYDVASNPFGLCIVTGYSPIASPPISGEPWYVNYEQQKVCWQGNSVQSSYGIVMCIQQNFYQNYQAQAEQNAKVMQNIVTVLTDFANFIGYAIPNFASLYQYSNGITTSTLSNGIETTANAGEASHLNGLHSYPPLGYSTGPWYSSTWHNSYIFGNYMLNHFKASAGGTQNNPVVNCFYYESTMKISYNGGPGSPLYSSLSYVFFNIGQYNV